MIAPRPGPDSDLTTLKPGAAMRPFFGVDIALMDPVNKVSICNVVTMVLPVTLKPRFNGPLGGNE